MDGIFDAAGVLADDYAAVDWASGPLGAPETWSPTLRSAVSLMLRTEFPVTLLWGPELVLVYNAAYVSMIGEKHPALGRPVKAVFPEAWDQIGPWLRAALEEGRTTYVEDALIPLDRHGFLEDCYFTFSYSPVVSPDGTDRGVIDIATETTERIINQRRLRLLGRLGELLAGVENPQDVPRQSLLLLREQVDDLVDVDLLPAGASWGSSTEVVEGAPPSLGSRDVLVEHDDDGPVVWLALRTTTDERPVGRLVAPALDDAAPARDPRPLLVVRPSQRLALDDDHLVFLRLVAGTMSQALDRVEALVSERRVAAAEHAMSETLQRSLLSTAQASPGTQVAVRYQPAVDLAEIGGDWHDSFLLADGRLSVAIGDVTGHDRQAAAAMAQIRNLLRGISYTLGTRPAEIVSALDHAMVGLGIGTFATAILATLAPAGPGGSPDRVLTWSNAGHPPPVLLRPDGSATLLHSEPELLLGLHPEAVRSDHDVVLEPGSSVLLFTDGLIERRSRPLEEGLQLVVDAVTGQAGLDPEALCDHVLSRSDPDHDDDIALVCLRID